MSENSQLTIKANFAEISKDYKNARKGFIEEEKKAFSLIESSTKQEKEKLEQAYKEYNAKVDKVLSSTEFKNIENKAKEHSQEISKNLLKAKKEFIKIREHVLKQDWSEEKKQKKIGELYQYVLNKLYTKEEMDKFQQLMGNMIITMPSNCKRLN